MCVTGETVTPLIWVFVWGRLIVLTRLKPVSMSYTETSVRC